MDTVAHSTVSKRSSLEPATYSLADFAALLGVSYTQAHERAMRGTLPVEPIRFGRQYKFPKATVDRLLGLTDSGVQGAA